MEELKDFKKSNTIEDAKLNSKPLLKAIQQRESKFIAFFVKLDFDIWYSIYSLTLQNKPLCGCV